MRIAIVATHPIQYYAPWFRHIATQRGIDLRVFYLWDFGARRRRDPGFERDVQWDVPLLDGYANEFVPNRASDPGTHRFGGLHNPGLVASVRSFRPDAVLLMGYNYRSFVEFLLRWRRGDGPLLFRGDSHRLVPVHRSFERLRRAAISAAFARFTAVLAVGRANRAYFRHHGVPRERIFFSPHAVDNARFIGSEARARDEALKWRWELGIPAHHRVILFAGKLVQRKRPLDLVSAFQQARLPNTSLLIVGSGPLEGEIRSRTSGDETIFLAPFQNQSAMPRTYAAADLFVLPSFGAHETWGLAVNEAMCLGVPPIVSDHVGCGLDLVRSGRNGFVFRAGDVDDLAAKLRDAMSSPIRLALWRRRCRRRVARYDYGHATAGLCNALEFAGVHIA